MEQKRRIARGGKGRGGGRRGGGGTASKGGVVDYCVRKVDAQNQEQGI